MKKCLLTGFIFLFTLAAFSQPGLHIGVFGTFNNTWIEKQDNYGTLAPFQNPVVRASELAYKYTWGGNGGVQVGYNFNKHWGVEAAILYNSTGQNYNDNFSGPATIPEGTFGAGGAPVNVQRSIKLTYLQVPLMGKYTVGSRKLKFFAAWGPQVGFRTSAREQVKIAGYVYLPDSLAFTPGQRFQTFDLGLAVQAGVQVYFTRHIYAEFGLSAYQGVLDINGAVLQQLGWYSKNDTHYKKSYNFDAGVTAGIHYLITFKKKIYYPSYTAPPN